MTRVDGTVRIHFLNCWTSSTFLGGLGSREYFQEKNELFQVSALARVGDEMSAQKVEEHEA